jgi:SAM-dependent methyltransferase
MSEQSYGVGLDNAWSGENQRLAGAQELFDPPTFRHLDTVGIRAGMRCLEVGGGAGSVARHMAERVGPRGRVLATDVDIRHLEGIDNRNVEVRIHDICNDLLEEDFDIIHARLVLEHLPQRRDVLEKLVSALRPGGWLLVEDLDWTTWLYLPSTRQFAFPARLARFCRQAVRATDALTKGSGADFFDFARNLPLHLVNVGLHDVDAESCTRLVRGGSAMSKFMTVSLRELGATLISTGHVSQRELDWAISAMESPGSMTMYYPVVSAWGQRPV